MATESVSILLRRVVACRCPVCGNGAIFQSHFKMNKECLRCHVVFWKDSGESLGAMYLDYAVATVAFIICWVFLATATPLSDWAQVLILCSIAAGAVLVFYPYTRSAWTVLVYLSGGIDRPQLRAIRGGRRAS
ncbi:MAG TPA: DUF983 domain-containing protein [Candidatus Binataceae bacterium]|nr:DUF983 domain-containing protein [Candidatus Binataceae bacterium]